MPELVSEMMVKARKEHSCAVCGDTAIRPGDTYQRTVWADAGDIWTWLLCAECAKVTGRVWDYVGGSACVDSIIGDDYVAWAIDMQGDSEHGASAALLLARIGRTPLGL